MRDVGPHAGGALAARRFFPFSHAAFNLVRGACHLIDPGDVGDSDGRAVTSSTPPAFRLRLVSKTSDDRSSSNWKQGEQSRAKQDNAEDGYRQESRGGKFVAHGTPLPCRPD